jgi:hypothetical protein
MARFPFPEANGNDEDIAEAVFVREYVPGRVTCVRYRLNGDRVKFYQILDKHENDMSPVLTLIGHRFTLASVIGGGLFGSFCSCSGG